MILIISTTVSATIDGFEDNDISEWSSNGGNWNVQTSFVYNGTYGLSGDNGNNHAELYRDDWNASNGAVNMSGYFYCEDVGLGNCGAGSIFGSSDNYYATRINPGGGSNSVAVRDRSEGQTIASSSCGGINWDTWYFIEYDINLDDGSHDAKIYDSSMNKKCELNGTDSTISSGKAGVKTYKDGTKVD